MVDHPDTAAISEHTEKSCLPIGLDIVHVPTWFSYSIQTREINIHIANVTTRMVSFQPRPILCEIQPVEFSKFSANEMQNYSRSDRLKNIKLGDSTLTNKQKEKVWKLLREYNDIFSKWETDIGHFTDVKLQINLSDELPFKQRYHRIAPSTIDEVRSQIEQLLSTGIIRKSKSPFASNVALVKKRMVPSECGLIIGC